MKVWIEQKEFQARKMILFILENKMSHSMKWS